jgi:aminoglycoside phosphotransferase family enzyme/predicted kinase
VSAEVPEPHDEELIEALAGAAAYPHDPSAREGIELIQTHLSYVFLTKDRVYKVHKAIDVGFVSFLRRAARNEDCLREVALNRRLSPDVYLGLAPIERERDGLQVGEVVTDPGPLGDREHCVVMRRLPEGRDTSTLLDRGELTPEQIDRVAERIAEFHAGHRLGCPSPFSTTEWLERVWHPVDANFQSLLESRVGCEGETVTTEAIEALRARARQAFARLQPGFEARRLRGLGVDAHGDLHLEHVWFEDTQPTPVIIDCIAFDDDLRHIDAASEVAFLAMDLGFRGHDDLGERFLATYARSSDDFDLYRVVDFFISYRAAVRGKVATLAAADPGIDPAQRADAASEAKARLAFATRALEPRAPGRVYLVGGIVGCGKSTAARALAAATRGIIISSDETRLRIPLAPEELDETDERVPGGWQEGRYSAAATARVYDEMLARAEAVVESGRVAILDASWARRDRREQAREWALRLGSHPVFVEVRCERQTALERLARRQAAGTDASEAGPELYDDFAAAFEEIGTDQWPADDRWIVHTDRDGWQDGLVAHARVRC